MINLVTKRKVDLEGIHISDLEELEKNLAKVSILGLDTETTELDPYTSEIILIQIGTLEDQYVIDCRDYSKKELQPILEILQSTNSTKVLVNAKFDYKQLRTNYNCILDNIEDTMLNEMILFCGLKNWGYSLKAMASRYLNYEFDSKQLSLFNTTLYKGIRNEISRLGNDNLTLDMVRYAAADVELALRIREKQHPLLKKYELLECAKLEWEYAMVLGDMELNGMYLDKQQWRELYNETLSHMKSIEANMRNWLVDNGLEEFEEINFASPKQLVELLNAMNLDTKVIDRKKTEDPDDPVFKDTTSSTHIQQYKDKNTFVRLLLEYREFYKAASTYGLKFMKQHVHPITNRIHSNYWQVLNTGRISSNSPNLQNIKARGRGKKYRLCFTNSDKLTTLIVADYSGQELRVLADKSKEPTMVNTFLHGDGDLHRRTASLLFHCSMSEVTNSQRYQGKQTNFLMSYGGGAHKLSKNMEIPYSEAEELIRKYYKSYTRLKKFFEQGHKDVLNNGYILIDNVVKRRSYSQYHPIYLFTKSFIEYYKARGWGTYIPKTIWSSYFRNKGKMERDSQNFKIQGTSASMSKYAGVLIRRYIKANNLWNSVKLVNMVHDEIVIECNVCFSPRIAQVTKKAMLEAGERFCPTVPMEIDPIITNTWQH